MILLFILFIGTYISTALAFFLYGLMQADSQPVTRFDYYSGLHLFFKLGYYLGQPRSTDD